MNLLCIQDPKTTLVLSSILMSCAAPPEAPKANPYEIRLAFSGFSSSVQVIEGLVTELPSSMAREVEPSATFLFREHV
jgi:hypothetical protein